VGTAGLVGVPAVLATLHANQSSFRWWWPTSWMIVPLVIFLVGFALLVVPVRRELRLQPLEPHYGDSLQYRHVDGNMTEHRIGLHNPAGNPEATGVKLEWTGMTPPPRFQNVHSEKWRPEFACWVPRLKGGEADAGVSLPPGQEELWMAVSTATDPNGIMNAAEFSPKRGNWHGLPWHLESGGQWRLDYRIVTENLPPRTFSLVISAEDGKIECELQD
jgi:hypothetical protein